MKFSIKDFLSKCDQIHKKLRIWSHLLKKSLMENLIFCAVILKIDSQKASSVAEMNSTKKSEKALYCRGLFGKILIFEGMNCYVSVPYMQLAFSD